MCNHWIDLPLSRLLIDKTRHYWRISKVINRSCLNRRQFGAGTRGVSPLGALYGASGAYYARVSLFNSWAVRSARHTLTLKWQLVVNHGNPADKYGSAAAASWLSAQRVRRI